LQIYELLLKDKKHERIDKVKQICKLRPIFKIVKMYKIISWISTIVFIVIFVLTLSLGELIIRFAFIFGYKAHQAAMHFMMLSVILELRITGMSFKVYRNGRVFGKDRPLIIVSNHQSIFDIPFEFWTFRKHHTKFVAKKELSKNLPTCSYHLRHGGHALIDRQDRQQAMDEIQKMGEKVEKYHWAGVIYPEGTRSRTGVLKEFKVSGFAKLLEAAPSALVVPVAIEGSWELLKYNFKPIPFGVKCKLNILEPIDPKAGNYTPEEILNHCELQIRKQLGQENVKINQ
jgi:1-acyl-sn-glycerol-3-phosphate acyltransferase